MSFDQHFLNRLKTDGRIPDILAAIIPDMKPNGRGYKALVPWRKDSHPSLRVDDKGGWGWIDEATAEHGDVIDLVSRLTGGDFPASVQWLADRLGLSIPDARPQPPKPKAKPETRLQALRRLYDLARPLGDGLAGAEYLRRRGLLEPARLLGVKCFEPGEPREIIGKAEQFGLATPEHFARKSEPFLIYPGTFRCRLLRSQKEAVGAGFKAAHWNPSTSDGLVLPVVWPVLPDPLPAEIILTEGETDALAVRALVPEAEAFAVLGTYGIGPDSEEFAAIVAGRPKITLAFQRDNASAKAAKRLIDLLQPRGVDCRAIVPAGGAKDWAQVIEWGQEAVSDLAEISAALGDYSIGLAFDALDRHIVDLEAGRIVPIRVPWQTVTWAMHGGGIPPGTVGLLSARTGGGKTWATYLWALNVAGFRRDDKLPVFMLNTEMAEENTALRMLAIASGNGAITGGSDLDAVKQARYEFQNQLDKLPIELTPPDPRSCEEAVAMFTEKAKTHKLLVLDHIGDLSYTGRSYEVLPEFTKAMRNLARQTGVVILLVTHLKADETGMDVLSYSKAIENIVDWSFSLQQIEKETVEVESSFGSRQVEANMFMAIRKNRFGKSGIKIAVMFDDKALIMADEGRVIHRGKGGGR